MKLLDGIKILNLAYNAPGPVAAQRLQAWGAHVVKIEPPGGDPLSRYCKEWYEHLISGQTVLSIDLKQPEGRAELEEWLSKSDLLITAVRLASVERLGLNWQALHVRHPELCHVAITGYPAPLTTKPGHDLTYQAEAGLLMPPEMPRTLAADMAGAERTVSAALALLLARARGLGANFIEVPISRAAADLAQPWNYGMTRPNGVAGGAFPGYRIYQALNGWVAIAALEEVFWQHLARELSLNHAPTGDKLEEIFQMRTAVDWQAWAEERDLPITAVR